MSAVPVAPAKKGIDSFFKKAAPFGAGKVVAAPIFPVSGSEFENVKKSNVPTIKAAGASTKAPAFPAEKKSEMMFQPKKKSIIDLEREQILQQDDNEMVESPPKLPEAAVSHPEVGPSDLIPCTGTDGRRLEQNNEPVSHNQRSRRSCAQYGANVFKFDDSPKKKRGLYVDDLLPSKDEGKKKSFSIFLSKAERAAQKKEEEEKRLAAEKEETERRLLKEREERAARIQMEFMKEREINNKMFATATQKQPKVVDGVMILDDEAGGVSSYFEARQISKGTGSATRSAMEMEGEAATFPTIPSTGLTDAVARWEAMPALVISPAAPMTIAEVIDLLDETVSEVAAGNLSCCDEAELMMSHVPSSGMLRQMPLYGNRESVLQFRLLWQQYIHETARWGKSTSGGVCPVPPLTPHPVGNAEGQAVISAWLAKWKQKLIASAARKVSKPAHKKKSSKRSHYYDSDDDLSDSDDESGHLTNVLNVYGASGTGKTTAVYEMARRMGFHVIEVNTSVVRSSTNVKKLIAEAVTSRKINLATVKTAVTVEGTVSAVAAPPVAADNEVVEVVDVTRPVQQARKQDPDVVEVICLDESDSGGSAAKQPASTTAVDDEGEWLDEAEKVDPAAKGLKRLSKGSTSTSSLAPVKAASSSTDLAKCAPPVSTATAEEAVGSDSFNLILFDEADIVFEEEDVSFFSGITQLIKMSKCPIVLTSGRRLPFILQFQPVLVPFTAATVAEMTGELMKYSARSNSCVSDEFNQSLQWLAAACDGDLRGAMASLSITAPDQAHSSREAFSSWIANKNVDHIVFDNMSASMQLPPSTETSSSPVTAANSRSVASVVAPVISRVEPRSALITGGTMFKIVGSGFLQHNLTSLRVLIDGDVQCETAVQSDTEVHALMPVCTLLPGFHRITLTGVTADRGLLVSSAVCGEGGGWIVLHDRSMSDIRSYCRPKIGTTKMQTTLPFTPKSVSAPSSSGKKRKLKRNQRVSKAAKQSKQADDESAETAGVAAGGGGADAAIAMAVDDDIEDCESVSSEGFADETAVTESEARKPMRRAKIVCSDEEDDAEIDEGGSGGVEEAAVDTAVFEVLSYQLQQAAVNAFTALTDTPISRVFMETTTADIDLSIIASSLNESLYTTVKTIKGFQLPAFFDIEGLMVDMHRVWSSALTSADLNLIEKAYVLKNIFEHKLLEGMRSIAQTETVMSLAPLTVAEGNDVVSLTWENEVLATLPLYTLFNDVKELDKQPTLDMLLAKEREASEVKVDVLSYVEETALSQLKVEAEQQRESKRNTATDYIHMPPSLEYADEDAAPLRVPYGSVSSADSACLDTLQEMHAALENLSSLDPLSAAGWRLLSQEEPSCTAATWDSTPLGEEEEEMVRYEGILADDNFNLKYPGYTMGLTETSALGYQLLSCSAYCRRLASKTLAPKRRADWYSMAEPRSQPAVCHKHAMSDAAAAAAAAATEVMQEDEECEFNDQKKAARNMVIRGEDDEAERGNGNAQMHSEKAYPRMNYFTSQLRHVALTHFVCEELCDDESAFDNQNSNRWLCSAMATDLFPMLLKLTHLENFNDIAAQEEATTGGVWGSTTSSSFTTGSRRSSRTSSRKTLEKLTYLKESTGLKEEMLMKLLSFKSM